ncbi:MAG TPA: hypothetical protein VEK73_01120 [Xanthobacteraceae bacterium]|nr:hypothetical protein [Xanthobacteraceae bacterium]
MKSLRTAAVLALAVVAGANAAEERPGAPPAAGAKETYASGLGELMSLQQMRHLKLWLAGAAKNWPLADYELDELKEGFDDLIKFFPTKDDMPVGDMAAGTAVPTLPEIKRAIDARDDAKFAAAFDQLTAACNSCHAAANHGFIVIQRPAASPYANQSFAPK